MAAPFLPPSAAPPAGWGPLGRGAPTTVRSRARPRRLSGFWRRAWGALVDGAVLSLLSYLYLLLIVAGALLIAWMTRDSKSTDTVIEIAARGVGRRVWWVLGGYWLLNLVTWYRFIPRQLAEEGSTIGMRQLGLSARDASSGQLISSSRGFRRGWSALGMSLIAAVGTTVIGSLLFGVPLRRLIPSRSVDLVVPLGRQSFGTLLAAILVAVLLWGGPTLLFFVDRRRQTLADKIAGSVVTVDDDPSWLAVAAFGTLLLGLVPLTLVFGHLAVFMTGRSPRLRGRGLAIGSLILAYPVVVVMGVGLFALGGADDRSPDAHHQSAQSAQTRQLLDSLLPSQATFAPDLVRIPAGSDGSYATAGCGEDLFGSPDASVEARYSGAQESARGLPVGLDVWIGTYDDVAGTEARTTGSGDRCSFDSAASARDPSATANEVGDREVLSVQLPYRVGSGSARRTVTLNAAIVARGHLAVLVLGADETTVAEIGTSIALKLP